MTRTPEHRAWRKARDRCCNPSDRNYPDYGGRGLSMCQEWRDSFLAFYHHIGPRPSPDHSLDRIDNDRGYEPGNVRWATRAQQARNRRATLLSPLDALLIRQMHLRGARAAVLAHAFGVSRGTVDGIVAGRKWRGLCGAVGIALVRAVTPGPEDAP